jgi:GTP-binding protein EngB required for normal cell division
MIRSNFNRELSADKSSVQASLNNNKNTDSTSNKDHFYQNMQQIKQQMSNNNPPKATFVSGPPPAPPVSELPKLNGTHLKSNSFLNKNGSINNASSGLTQTNSNSLSQTKTKTLDGYVGFANLPNQVYRKSVKKGFEFNLMIIGESALGKSTFVNSLFLTELYNPTDFPGTFERRKKTTVVDSTSVMLTEKGVTLRLNIIDTPGFGDNIDNSDSWQPIIEYIDSRYEDYLSNESKVNRKLPINDQRIHCCLFFISPGHT